MCRWLSFTGAAVWNLPTDEITWQPGSTQISAFTGFRILVEHENINGLWHVLLFQELASLYLLVMSVCVLLANNTGSCTFVRTLVIYLFWILFNLKVEPFQIFISFLYIMHVTQHTSACACVLLLYLLYKEPVWKSRCSFKVFQRV